MRMKQKLMSLALVLAMALTLLPTMAFADQAQAACTGDDATTNHTTESGGSLSLTEAKAATCTAAGNPKYYTCSVCGWYIEVNTDDTLKEPVQAAPSLAIDSTAHPAESVKYVTTAEGHKRHCEACNADVDNTVTAHDTNGADGACSVCGYKASTTPDPGTETKFTTASYDTTTGKLTWTYGVADAATSDFSVTLGETAVSAQIAKDAEGVFSVAIAQTSSAQTATITYTSGQTTDTKTCTIPAQSGGGDTPDPDPAAPAITSVNYDYNTGALTWTATNVPDTTRDNYFFVQTYNTNDPENPISSWNRECMETTADPMHIQVTKNGTTYSCVYKPEVLPDGSYKLTIQYPNGGPANAHTDFIVSTVVPVNPTTPSTGVPNAGTVTDAASAQTAVDTLKNTSNDTIKATLETGDAAVENYAALEAAVVKATGLTVSVEPDRTTPSAAASVTITGAAFNAAPNAKEVALEVSGASRSYSLGRKYDASDAVAFSMTLTGVSNASRLEVPVVIQMPVPSGISTKRLVVLHYHNSSTTPEVLTHKITGKTLSFVVTGFSDFVIAETASTTTTGGSSSGGGASSGNISRPVVVTPPSTTTTTPAGIFTDVPANHSFASQITWARDNSIMGGYADGSFRPNNTTNRQQLWMVLARLAGAAPADMAAAREWAISAGISDGSSPDGSMSRQQLVTMLYRYAQSKEQATEGAADLSTYPDSGAVASYASEALAWAVGNGIVTGTSDGRLNPEGTATRGQFAVMLYRFSHLS